MRQNRDLPNIIFLGPSGSGKSECCSYLEKKYGYKNFHPYGFMKRFYEDLYLLEPGDLDDPQIKNSKAEGMKVSFQEMMVKEYFFRRETDPFFVSRNYARELSSEIRPVCFQGIRNIEEVQAIENLRTGSFVNGYILVYLEKDNVPEVNSDENLYPILNRLRNNGLLKRFMKIQNDGPLKKLFHTIDLLMVEQSPF
jgi:adenylate kinase family enzyme